MDDPPAVVVETNPPCPMEVVASTKGRKGALKALRTLRLRSVSFSWPSPLVKAAAKWLRSFVLFLPFLSSP